MTSTAYRASRPSLSAATSRFFLLPKPRRLGLGALLVVSASIACTGQTGDASAGVVLVQGSNGPDGAGAAGSSTTAQGAGGAAAGGSTARGGAATSMGGATSQSLGGAPGSTCPSPIASDEHLQERQSCTFKAGDRTSTTMGITDAQRASIPLRHIVVVMKENRSFDHIFGGLRQLQPDADVADATFVNDDDKGVAVPMHHLSSLCLPADPPHNRSAMHKQVDTQPDGTNRMDGFVRNAARAGNDGHYAMGFYDQNDLPFSYFLADTFAISDRYFSSFRGPTFPNRNFLLLGTSAGVTETFVSYPDASYPTVFDELDAAGVSWGVYGEGHALEETLNAPNNNWEKKHPWYPVAALLDAFANDTVPSVVFVDGSIDIEDEHPPTTISIGQAWTKRLYDAAIASKAWGSTALLLTYDESGGFADHVSPSNHACEPESSSDDVGYNELGARVPFIAISPWARRHYVSHIEHEHTSITRFIQAVFDLPAMTARDANSSALFDMFDFACAPAPIPTAPSVTEAPCK